MGFVRKRAGGVSFQALRVNEETPVRRSRAAPPCIRRWCDPLKNYGCCASVRSSHAAAKAISSSEMENGGVKLSTLLAGESASRIRPSRSARFTTEMASSVAGATCRARSVPRRASARPRGRRRCAASGPRAARLSISRPVRAPQGRSPDPRELHRSQRHRAAERIAEKGARVQRLARRTPARRP